MENDENDDSYFNENENNLSDYSQSYDEI